MANKVLNQFVRACVRACAHVCDTEGFRRGGGGGGGGLEARGEGGCVHA